MKLVQLNIKRFKTKVAVGSLVAYAALMLPLYYIARYDVPSADDYSTSWVLASAFEDSMNPLHWLESLWNNTVQQYLTLQGTFSSHFFTSICPLAISEKAYCIGPIILLTAFSLGLFFLLREVLCGIFSMPTENAVILFCGIASLSIQLMPSVAEGFYWWSGAALYTGFFALSMFVLCYYLKLLRQKIEPRKIGHYIFMALLFFIVGGSNFPTALTTWIIVTFSLCYIILEKRKQCVVALIAVLSSLGGLMVNVLSPGNTVRMLREEVTYVPSIGGTLRISFRLGFQYFRSWFTVPVILILILAIPVIYDGLRSCRKKFRCPLFFSICTICTFCALFAPTAYSYGWIGPARYMNVVYFGFVLLLFANEVYYIGWLCAKLQEITGNMVHRNSLYGAITQKFKKYFWGVLVGAIGIIIIVSQPNFYIDATTPGGRKMYATESAIVSLKRGQARQYYYEYSIRREQLLDKATQVLTFSPYTCKPEVLYFDDITDNPKDWRNVSLANYYKKESVVLRAQG